MEVSLTTLSPNGQIVIPSDIRKEAGLKPATKFIVYQQNGTIMLKQLKTENLRKEMELIERIRTSEEQIKKGKNTKVRSTMSDEDIDEILMS